MTNDNNSEAPQKSAKDRISEKLARLKEINRERPCSECIWHNAKNGYYSCDAAIGSCNFEHNRFTRVGTGVRKVRPKSIEIKNKSKETTDKP